MRLTTYLLLRAVASFVNFGGGINADASSNRDRASPNGEVVDVYQFSCNKSFIDNIVFRRDGSLLLTRIDVPEVWSVDTQTGAGSLIYDFSQESARISSCFGITEIDRDVFTVVTGDFDVETFSATPGSFGVWKLDFNDYHRNWDDTFNLPPKKKSTPTVTKVVDLPEAMALGASTLFTSRESRYLLISDSPEGIIWRLDLNTGEYNPALSDDSMSPAPNGPVMGVNGIRVFNRYLYYASVTRKELRRVKLDGAANAIGPFELVMEDIGVDNLDISGQGDVYLAVNSENLIMSITAEGNLVQVAGGKNSTALAGPTCCALRPGVDELFVGTNGGIFAPVDGWFEEPGKVSAIRI